MSDDHPTICDIGRNLPQAICDILVRKSVEAISPNALVVEMFRNCKMVRSSAMAAMERRIEAGNLR
jgi:hypothetical protein